MTAERWRHSVKILGTWFGCGRSPYVPGTVGTLGGLPLVWLFGLGGDQVYLVATVVFVVFAVFVAQFYEQWVATAHDRPEFVIDEVAGMLVTMAMVPLTGQNLLLGFLLFRVFDMVKPFPISYVDRRVLGGVGTVADDLLAGIVSNVVLQYVLHKGVLG